MQSLRKRPTYNEVVNYLENDQPKIKYPDRRATFLRNSPYLSQFDGDSWIDLEEQENNINKEKMKELAIQKVAGDEKTTAQVLRIQTRLGNQTFKVPKVPQSTHFTQTAKEEKPKPVQTASVGTQKGRSDAKMYSYAPVSDTDDIDDAIHQTANDIQMEEEEQKRLS